MWWLMLVISIPGRLGQEDCNDLKDYIRNPSSKHQSKAYIQIGVVLHNPSPSTWEVEQENQEFKANLFEVSLGYVRSSIRKQTRKKLLEIRLYTGRQMLVLWNCIFPLCFLFVFTNTLIFSCDFCLNLDFISFFNSCVKEGERLTLQRTYPLSFWAGWVHILKADIRVVHIVFTPADLPALVPGPFRIQVNKTCLLIRKHQLQT